MNREISLSSIQDKGSLDVCYIKHFWSKSKLNLNKKKQDIPNDFYKDRLMMDALNLGMTNTIKYIFQNNPSFEEFEDWIVQTGGKPSKEIIDRFNSDILGTQLADSTFKMIEEIDNMPDVLSEDDLKFWEENGYIILKQAVSNEDCKKAQNVIWDFLDASPEDKSTWYQGKCSGIMVELVHHEVLESNRNSKRIHKAFSQLWKTADLWASVDRCGFNPPHTEQCNYLGPPMHWDVDFSSPRFFWTQGVLYLNDVSKDQGAFTLVPGFHHRYDEWMEALPDGTDPQKEDLHALGSIPIAGEAGDLIIWRHELPHSSSPNMTEVSRFVQYINYYSGRQQLY